MNINSYGARPSLRLAAAILAALGFVLFLGFVNPDFTHAAAGTNQQLNYQGRLLDNTGAVVADGTYNMEFKIYQDGTGCVSGGSSPCGGTLKWTETRIQTNRVTVKNGYFSVNLGSITAFGAGVDWNQDTLWLSINIGGVTNTPTPTWDGEMTAFKRLTSTPYALNSYQLGGLQAANFVQLAQGVQTDTSTANASIFVNKNNSSGTPNILQLQKSSSDVLVIDNNGGATFSPGSTADVVVNADADSNLQVNYSSTTDATLNIANISISDNASASTGALYGLAVVNNDNGANTGVPDALAYLNNANAADTVVDGLLVEQTGAGTLTNGLEIKRTAGTVTNGLTFTGTFGAVLKVGSTTVINASGQVPTAQLTGNYVANTATSVLTGLSGGSAGSTGASLNLAFDYSQALSGDVSLAANAAVFGQSGLVFEGSSADTNETYIAVANPTSDHTFTFGDVASGNICISAISCAATSGTAGTFTGNYVASVANGTGITGGAAGSNAAALTLGIDQTAALTWTGNTAFTPSGTNNVVFTGDNDSGLQVNSTFTGTGPTQNALSITLTHNATAAGTSYGLSIINADNGANAGVPAALAYLNNANAAETVVDGLLVEQTGVGTLTNGLEIKQTAGTVTNGLTFTGTFGTSTLKVGANTILNGTGVLQSVGLSGTYSNALTLSSTTNSFAGNSVNIAATAVPSVDIVRISNAGQGVTTAGINGLSINYVGGAAAVEAAGQRIDLTGGTTAGAGAIWSGLRIVQGTITAGTTVQDVKLETAALTTTSGATVINGLNLSTAGAINNATAGSITWNGLNITNANITQGAGGSSTSNTLALSLGTITTGGIQNGLNFSNITAPTAGSTRGLFFGTGWTDTHSSTAANNNLANILLTGTSAGSAAQNFTIKSSNNVSGATTATPLFELRDLTNTNNARMYGLAIADAFISKQSYWGEEYSNFKGTTCTNNGTNLTALATTAAGNFGVRGDGSDACLVAGSQGELSADFVAGSSATSGSCTYTTAAAPNGYEEITAVSGQAARSTACLETNNNGAAGGQYALFNSGNMPQIAMKFRAGNGVAPSATNFYYAGIADRAVAVTSGPTNSYPVTMKGAYFTNCSSPNATVSGCGNTWFGVMSDGGTTPASPSTNEVACPATDAQGSSPQNASFMYGRIEFRRDTSTANVEVQYFIDYDVTNGIYETSCGTMTTTGAVTGNTAMGVFLDAHSAGSATAKLDIDYFRVWQDDAPTSATPSIVASQANTNAPNAVDTTAPAPLAIESGGGPDPESTNTLINFMAATEQDAVFGNDVYVHGTLYVDKIKANQIEGMEIITNKISSLGAQLAKDQAIKTAESSPPVNLNNLTNVQAVSLSVLAQIEAKGGLRVDKDAQFNGKTLFALLAEFNGPAKFNGQVSFNNDAGGTALIKKDARKVDIKFSKDYTATPIISANYLFNGLDISADQDKQQRLLDGGYSFVISQTTSKGFTIVLNKPATEDISFSWLATLINNPQISQSQPISTAGQ